MKFIIRPGETLAEMMNQFHKVVHSRAQDLHLRSWLKYSEKSKVAEFEEESIREESRSV